MRMLFVVMSVALCNFALVAAEDEAVGFDPEKWDMSRARVMEHLGRQAVIGTAVLKDVVFEDGVIEFDVAATAGRSYPGLFFRMQSPSDYEHLYIRPHRAGLYADALQYTPNTNGMGNWQLYNGSGYTSTIDFDTDRWITVRLEVEGDQARVFIDGAERPALEISRLEHGHSKGGIALNTLGTGNAFVSNLRYRADDSLHFEKIADPGPVPGVISSWQLSQTLSPREIEGDLHPVRYDSPTLTWQDVETERSGLLDFSRHVKGTPRSLNCIYARTVINEKEAVVREYRFGYSDAVTVFLNGEPVFSGNSAYTARDSSFLGILGTFDSIYLPLKKGDNELLVLVQEVFGGWGIKFQDTAATYLDRSVSSAWETAAVFRTPETVLFDPAGQVMYVSHYDAYNRSVREGNQSVARLAPDGKLLELDWIGGLFNPTGMAMRNGRLLVVERRAVAEIDPASASIVDRHDLPSPRFPNDIAVGADGTVYVSDSARGLIYRRSGVDFEEWLNDGGLLAPNGLHADGDRLLVGDSGDYRLKSVDLATGEITTLARMWPGVIDGIEGDGRGNFIVSYAGGRIYRVTPDGRTVKLLDLEPGGVATANFEYIPDMELMVVPTLTSDSVKAFRLSR